MASNSTKVAEIKNIMGPDGPATWISGLWEKYNNQRGPKLQEWAELDAYLFATDTTTTSNSSLPWKNSTTIPKLTQLRDNLHSNYISALFPNDRWLQWQGYSLDDSTKAKAQAITSYMDNKAREGGLRSDISRALYDYIDKGNAFMMPSFERRYVDYRGEKVAGFIGPRSVRISPYDIVFNPLANTLHDTHKIVRSRKTIGELMKLSQTNPEQHFWKEAVQKRLEVRERMGGHTVEDWNKAVQYSIDGFGSMYEYLQSDDVEILEFYGDFYDSDTKELSTDRMITVVDRSWVVRNEPIQTYDGRAPIFHVGWRTRPDNLWAMGPLDNLVGMQYRLDHLENLKADAMDLAVLPPLAIVGEVEAFNWEPGARVNLDEGGSIQEITKSLNAMFAASSEMQTLSDTMELFAGAPREAMGVRSPGEKTAFEVQALDNAAGRIFQEKISHFEIEMLEPMLNAMLEIAHANMDGADVIRTLDDDLGVQQFRSITKEDLTAKGILRPIGARHFSQRAQDMQNLIGVFNSPVGNMIAPHTSSKSMTKLIEESLDIRGYKIFRPNVAVMEQQETQALLNQGQEDLDVQSSSPSEADIEELVPPEGAPV